MLTSETKDNINTFLETKATEEEHPILNIKEYA